MGTLKRCLVTVIGCFLLIHLIAFVASIIYSDTHPAPDPYLRMEPPARYPVWEDSPDPFAVPRDYFRQVRAFPRRLHLMRPDLIPYPLLIETYA